MSKAHNHGKGKSWSRPGGPVARRWRAERTGCTGPQPHQVAAAMLGLEHLGHLSEVAPEVLLVGCAGEGDSDDPLCDVHQVQLTAVLHGSAHTHVSGERGGRRGSRSEPSSSGQDWNSCTPLHITCGPQFQPRRLGSSLTQSQSQRPPLARPVQPARPAWEPGRTWAGAGRISGQFSHDSNPRCPSILLALPSTCDLRGQGQGQDRSQPGAQESSSASQHTVATWSGRSLPKDPGTDFEEEGEPELGGLQQSRAEHHAAPPCS